jgi:leucyl aminopeptidase (aminopeptidase T)
MRLKLVGGFCLIGLLVTADGTATPSSSAFLEHARSTNTTAVGLSLSRAKKGAPTDFEQLARRLVTESAGVKKGEIVLVDGYPQDQELVEDVAVNVRKLGAFPFVGLNSDRLTKRLFEDVPARYDPQTDALALKLAQILDVEVFVTGSQNEDLLGNADPVRLAAQAKASEPVQRAFLRNKVRFVEVGNGLYPTPQRAKRLQMSLPALAKTFWNGVNIDYRSLQARGEQVRRVLARGSELQITNPNGTNLRVRVKGRPVFVSDGIISAADVRKASAGALNVFLPAGEVYTTPVPGTAEGTIVHTRDFQGGKEIRNLTLTFAAGKLTSIKGSGPGFKPLKAQYDAAQGRKDEFSFVDLGINPNIKLPPASRLGNWVPAGTITVGIGNNTWAGGDNSVPYGYTIFLPGSTVKLDGRTIIENGQLKL